MSKNTKLENRSKGDLMTERWELENKIEWYIKTHELDLEKLQKAWDVLQDD